MMTETSSFEKKYLHLTFMVAGEPEKSAVRVSLNGDMIVEVKSNHIPNDLRRLRKMSKHAFWRWLQTRPGYKGIDLTQRAL